MVRHFPETFVAKAQLLCSGSFHTPSNVRIGSHRVQVSQTLLAEPYKYSNSRDTSSMVVCCITWEVADFGELANLWLFKSTNIETWKITFTEILHFVQDFACGLGRPQPAQLAEKNSSLYTWGFPETSRQLARWKHWAGRVHG